MDASRSHVKMEQKSSPLPQQHVRSAKDSGSEAVLVGHGKSLEVWKLNLATALEGMSAHFSCEYGGASSKWPGRGHRWYIEEKRCRH
jgi:hypothetical protein